MRTTTDYSFGPPTTSPIIRGVLALFIGISLGLALLDPWSIYFTGVSMIRNILALSWRGFSSFYLWQPLTYFWIETAGAINFTSLISLVFKGYMIWVFGSAITERYGSRFFLTLFLGSGIITGLLLLPILAWTAPAVPITGMTAPLLSLFVFWAMMNHDGTIFLFFIFPIKVRTLLTVVLAIVFLMGISSGDLATFALEFCGVLWGYVTAAGWWGLRSPYASTSRYDKVLEMVGDAIRLRSRQIFPKKKSSKVVSIETGEPIDEDEIFLDAMLAKISEHGESSLSWRERRRLKKISQNRKDQKK